ncbi:MAG: hypothetical protein P8Z77_03715 [Candidatus Thiodiazotropha sp.]
MALGAVVISNPITVSGINTTIPISINNGDYRINDGVFTNAAGQVSTGDTVEVRLTASTSDSTTVEATLTLGGVSDTFSVSTAGANLPDSFAFTDQTDVFPGALIESNAVTITGLTAPAAISVAGGEYRLDGGTYTAVNGTVANNQTVQVRQTAPSSFSATTNTTLSIGGVSDTFSVTTIAADTTPDAFGFIDQTGVSVSTSIVSNTIVVSGINTPVAIAVTNGAYSINNGPFVTASSTVNNGDEVRVRVTSADTVETSVDATLSLGGVSDIFSVTTIAADTTPDAFGFTDQTDVSVSTVISSNSIAINGINTATPISISGGEYAINGGAFSSTASTISNGQTVRVRQTSSASYSATTDAVLTVGSVSDTFSVTTAANSSPTATNVTIRGTAQVGNVLTGSYTFNDVDGDEEGTSTFRWLRNGSAISGATAQTYTLVTADSGRSITFEVTPIAATGIPVGSAAMSNAVSTLTMNITFPPAGTNYGGYTAPVGSGPGLELLKTLPVVDDINEVVYLANETQVLEVGLNNGARRVIYDSASTGDVWFVPSALALDSGSDRVFMTSAGYSVPGFDHGLSKSLLTVDLSTASLSIVSGLGIGNGVQMSLHSSYYGLVFDDNNNRIILQDHPGLMFIDLNSGDRVIMSNYNFQN